MEEKNVIEYKNLEIHYEPHIQFNNRILQYNKEYKFSLMDGQIFIGKLKWEETEDGLYEVYLVSRTTKNVEVEPKKYNLAYEFLDYIVDIEENKKVKKKSK